jgi:hypothetical protein
MSAAPFIVLGLVGCLSVFVNRDPFSPSKFAVAYLAVFYADLVVSPYRWEVAATFLVLVTMVVPAMLMERPMVRRVDSSAAASGSSPWRFAVAIWLVSLVPMIAQFALMDALGGFEGFLLSIPSRVLRWRSMGYLTVFVGWSSVFNQVYFAYGLAARVRSRVWWAGYGLHLAQLLPLMLLTGSRSSVLMVVVFMLMIYHYLRTGLSKKTLAVFASALIVASVVLGILRSEFRFSDGVVETGVTSWEVVADGIRSTQMTRYGLDGIERTLEVAPRHLQYGLTYVAAITNVVPRRLWPGKPDTGGVVFTNEYYAASWGGLSFATPGIVGEAILNFGQLTGLLVGLGLWLAILIFLARQYSRRLADLTNGSPLVRIQGLLLYLNVMVFLVGLSVGEFAGTLVALGAGRVAPLMLSMAAVRLLLSGREGGELHRSDRIGPTE